VSKYGGIMQGYEEFGGAIGRTLAESTPWWPTPRHPKADAPNILVILVDDLGFSHFSCFGSDLETPNIDALASDGLRYTNFHVTPLCSPTRAALLTGRNHHSVGMRGLSNWSSGYPSMRGHISPHAATMAELLREEGYTTFAVGKWHLAAMENASAAGPFDQWPLQRGFDRFYGFLDGETDQFAPDLVYDNHHIEPPRTPAEGYHLTEDLIDKTLEFITDTTAIRPDRPFFTYLALGAMHAPHQAPAAYLERHRGRYDEGWDVAREKWFAKQRATGIVGSDTALAPRNPGVDPWDTLPDNQRRLAARMQEAFAAFLEHTDEQLGRLFDGLRDMELMDDTLILLMSDNGASQEGGPFGVMHEMKFFNFILEQPDEAIKRIDDIGGPHSHANYPWGWAQAGNTPFKWYKQNTHEGGVHVPLIAHWPKGIKAKGELRSQFHYVTDIAPTVLEAAGVTVPETYRGARQMPLAGASLSYSFGDATTKSPKTSQYFEMVGHRAMYHDGWKAVTRHQPGVAFDDDVWELYHVATDASECHDLASEEPERLAELIAMWWREAETYGVLPLDDRGIELFSTRYRDNSPHPSSRFYSYRPLVSAIPPQAAVALGGRSWDMSAFVTVTDESNGVLLATGNENAGLSFFALGGRLHFDYNVFGDHQLIVADEKIGAGEHVLGVRFRRGQRDANVVLTIDGREVAEGHLPFMMRIISSIGMTIGKDLGSPVSDLYQSPFAFTGTLHHLDVQLISANDQQDQEASAREGMARQ